MSNQPEGRAPRAFDSSVWRERAFADKAALDKMRQEVDEARLRHEADLEKRQAAKARQDSAQQAESDEAPQENVEKEGPSDYELMLKNAVALEETSLRTTGKGKAKFDSAQRLLSRHHAKHVASTPTHAPLSPYPPLIPLSEEEMERELPLTFLGMRGLRGQSPHSYRTAQYDQASPSTSASDQPKPQQSTRRSCERSYKTRIVSGDSLQIVKLEAANEKTPSVATSHQKLAGSEAPLVTEDDKPRSGEIGVAVTTQDDAAELSPCEKQAAQSISGRSTRSINGRFLVTPPLPSIVEDPSRHCSVHDPEAALPSTTAVEKARSSKLRKSFYMLPWIIMWLGLFFTFATLIGRDHKPFQLALLSAQQDKDNTQAVASPQVLTLPEPPITELEELRVPNWQSFSHTHEYQYALTWPQTLIEQYFDTSNTNTTLDKIESLIDEVAGNATLDKIEAQPCPANACPAAWDRKQSTVPAMNDAWIVDLHARTMPNVTGLWVDMKVLATHKVDLTSFCAPPKRVEPQPQPSPSPSPSPLPSSTASARFHHERKSTTLVRNLLTCLWFLPILLLVRYTAREIAARSMTGLGLGENKMVIRVLFIGVAFLAASGLALGTEVLVRMIAEGRYGD